jgi:hypothetical protein
VCHASVSKFLPDGIWFGWVEDVASDSVDFDLACLWPGRVEPAASNDVTRIRTVPVDPNAVAYDSGGEIVEFAELDGVLQTVANAPRLRATLPFWLFVNDGVVTEISEHAEPITWARSSDAWPGLEPGCCDGGEVAPPSPDEPLPETGWPTDGFYKAWNMDSSEYVHDWPESATPNWYELQIARFG